LKKGKDPGRAARNRGRIEWQLRERVKELDALHRAARMLQSHGRPAGEALGKLLKALTKAWQHPQLAMMRIAYGGRKYSSPGFRRTRWRQQASFAVRGVGRGSVETCYRRRPSGPGRSFLPEEAKLLGSLARLLQAFFVRHKAEQRLLRAKTGLQRTVARRTSQLRSLNESLRAEISERRRNERKIRRYQARLKLLALQLAMFEEQERREIAADLHDHIGQTLMMAKLNLSQLRAAARDAGLASSLEEIGGLLDQAINYTRNLTFEVIPPVLYELGLLPAIEWLSEHFREKHGLEVSVRGEPPAVILDRKLQFVLYMAVRELLFNVVKHAAAGRAQIAVTGRGQSFSITVADDGRGFDAEAAERRASATRGYGLFGIREKLHYFSGNLKIESAAGRGSRITMEVPAGAEGQR
jgi:signal transduction histidine kinase